MTINLLGDIAAGKGTQAGFLVKKYDLNYIDTGSYSRSLVKKKVKGAIGRVEKGNLTKSDLIKNYLRKELENLPFSKGVLLDGAKMPSEAKLVNNIWKKQKRDILVLYLKIPKSESLKRLKSRQRADDDPRAIKNRVSYYEKIYSKTIDYWKKQGLLKTINGNRSVAKVRKDLDKAIKDFYGAL